MFLKETNMHFTLNTKSQRGIANKVFDTAKSRLRRKDRFSNNWFKHAR